MKDLGAQPQLDKDNDQLVVSFTFYYGRYNGAAGEKMLSIHLST